MPNAKQSIKIKTPPKDFFLHLLSILALYFSAISFLVLIFQYINIWLPDQLNQVSYEWQHYEYLRQIRWSLASLLVVFPTYLLSGWYLAKRYKLDPSKKQLRIRRWLIYFTLFVAVLIIIGDLVSLIYNFLGGELTGRFVLKVLAVFFVAASIFVHYFWQIKQQEED